MTKYILHGGFASEHNTSNKMFFDEFVRDIPDGGKVLLVHFAAREKDPTPKYRQRITSILESAGDKRFIYQMATRKNFLDELIKSDAIFFNGGSTNKLLEALRTYSDIKPLLVGKTVAGTSAGAYALAKYGPGHSNVEVREGVGCVPIRVVCHYESPKLPPHPTSLEMLTKTAPELELLYLHDFEWKSFRY